MVHTFQVLRAWLRLRAYWFAGVGALLVCAVYLGLAITPSSYAVGMRLMGQPADGLIAGSAKPIRSDEYGVFTPYVQIAVHSKFGKRDLISPYHEELKTFFPLPVLNWAAIFKPYYAAFLVLPAANAFSFFYLFCTLAFIGGWALLLRELGIKSSYAVAGSLIFFFSQFIQVWWTSNCGVLAMAPWPAVAWLAIDRRWLRLLLCTYLLTVWLLAGTYPPFLYAAGFVILVAVVAARPDRVRPARVIDAAIAVVVAAAIFYGYFGDLITTMSQTLYPGRRVTAGGGIEPAKFWAQIYPFAITNGYQPLPMAMPSNACEVGVVGSLLPVLALLFVDYSGASRIIRKNGKALLVFLVGTGICTAWIFFPVPSGIGRWLGLTFVPPNRLLYALGLLVLLLAIFVIQKFRFRFSWARLGWFFVFAVGAILVKLKLSGTPWNDTISYFDYMPIAAGIVVGLMALFKRANGWMMVCVVACLVNLVTFGVFNPIQSAYPIFAMNKQAIRQYLLGTGAEANKQGVIAVPAEYGAMINGVGIPSFNTVLLSPQPGFFRKYFPDLPRHEFNFLFNRYAHIMFNKDNVALVVQVDQISLPLSRFAGSMADKPAKALATSTPFCSVDTINGQAPPRTLVLKLGSPATFGGWLATVSKQPARAFTLQLEGTYPFSASGSETMVRPDVAEAIHGEADGQYGYNLTTDFGGARPGRYGIVLRTADGETCRTPLTIILQR